MRSGCKFQLRKNQPVQYLLHRNDASYHIIIMAIGAFGAIGPIIPIMGGSTATGAGTGAGTRIGTGAGARYMAQAARIAARWPAVNFSKHVSGA
jgi:hypothetical protein